MYCKVLYSVIMTFAWVVSSVDKNVYDLSHKCGLKKVINIYLTTGKETSDYSIALIANEEKLECIIMFSTRVNNYVMVVIQFVDWVPGKHVCTNNKNNIYVIGNKAHDVCAAANESEAKIFRHLGKALVSVVIASFGNMSSIKITATSMRFPEDGSCHSKEELDCSYKNKTYCMTHATHCDGHINCGVDSYFDENKMECEASRLTPIVVVFSLLMSVLTIFLIISITIAFIPKRKESFIYRAEDSLSLFDCTEDFNNYEINVQVIFPEETLSKRKPDIEDQSSSSSK